MPPELRERMSEIAKKAYATGKRKPTAYWTGKKNMKQIEAIKEYWKNPEYAKHQSEIRKGKHYGLAGEFKKGQHYGLTGEFKKGQPSWNLGLHVRTRENYEQQKGEKSKVWRGGQKMARVRYKAIRRTYGCETINEPFPGSEGHHIDKEHIVFIPKEIHRSVWHTLNRPETMEQINTKVICWLLGVG